MRSFATSLITALSFVIGLPSLANEYRDHPSAVLDQARYPQFSFIGLLERKYTDARGQTVAERGNAIIVSPCYILTNRHVVFNDDDEGARSEKYNMVFRAGVGDDDDGFAGHTIATPVLWGKAGKGYEQDWALLRLENCAGASPRWGWAEASRTPDCQFSEFHDDPPIIAVGFTGGLPMRYSFGRIRGTYTSSDVLLTDASYTHGQSGGGLFHIETDTSDRLIPTLCALTTGGKGIDGDPDRSDTLDTWTGVRTNIALSVFMILHAEPVQVLLEADKRSFSRPNPIAENLRLPLPPPPAD